MSDGKKGPGDSKRDDKEPAGPEETPREKPEANSAVADAARPAADRWRLARFIPEGKLDLVLLSAAGAAALFLVLWIAWIVLASARAERLSRAEAALADARGKLAEAGRKAGDPQAVIDAGPDLQALEAARAETAKEKESRARAEAQVEEMKAAASLEAEKGRALAAQLEALKADVGSREEKLAEVARLAEKAKGLEAAAAEVPSAPLPEADAEKKMGEFAEELRGITDRDRRIELAFRAKVVLAGTAQEPRAHDLWEHERAAKQADIDRAARVPFDDARAKVRAQPKSHDENVALLRETLPKVEGSRYEKAVQGMIDAELRAKASGR